MRHRYDTRAFVLSRSPLGEANALVTLLTPGLGLVRARAQGVRTSGAKLAAALTTFAESAVILVRGKEGWRVAGAVLESRWSETLSKQARESAIRITGLLLRLVPGETADPDLYTILEQCFHTLVQAEQEAYEAIEILALLRVLAVLGLDAGEIPLPITDFSPETLAKVRDARLEYVARVNHGIEASGL